MKKAFLAAGFVVATGLAASAQSKKQPPPPPPPIPVEMNVAPPPPPPPPPDKPQVPPVPPPPPPEVANPKEFDAFLKRNPGINRLLWSEANRLHVHLKSGEEETYNLADKEDVKKLEAKYGKLPAPPPPPKPSKLSATND